MADLPSDPTDTAADAVQEQAERTTGSAVEAPERSSRSYAETNPTEQELFGQTGPASPNEQGSRELGGKLADVATAQEWAAASPDARQDMANQMNGEIRAADGLRPSDPTWANLPEGTLGGYYPQTNEVRINEGLLQSDDPAVVRTLAHENRHEVQQEYLNGTRPPDSEVGPQQIESWREPYPQGSSNTWTRAEFEQYRNHPREVDARQAGDAAYQAYIDESDRRRTT